MTTTTERPRVAPSQAVSALDLRLYLVALLANIYVVAWWTFGSRAPAPPAEPDQAASQPARPNTKPTVVAQKRSRIRTRSS